MVNDDSYQCTFITLRPVNEQENPRMTSNIDRYLTPQTKYVKVRVRTNKKQLIIQNELDVILYNV